MRTTVIGAGAWGTTLANLLARKGEPTTLWVREAALLDEITKTGRNTWFLPDYDLDPGLTCTTDAAQALAGADCFLAVVPSQFLRGVLAGFKELLPDRPAIICASKGIEMDTLKPMSEVVAEALEGLQPRYAALSGPSFADEVSRGLPTSVTLGCSDPELGRCLRNHFSTDRFRVYTDTDFRGVELGGAVKNVVAIAAGISDGLGFGHDARAALITRGLAEMSRLGKAMGARVQTFMGLSGMGDLVLTCTGDLSRNRQVGLGLGQGKTLAQIQEGKRTVAEGVKTTQALYDLSRRLGEELPITEQVHAILYEDKPPKQAVQELMGRSL
ncbi:MAG: NAD(P)H-dependent glycerol-3-phosphate dehydrogenase, partial [Desulfovibrionaceae bacterium]